MSKSWFAAAGVRAIFVFLAGTLASVAPEISRAQSAPGAPVRENLDAHRVDLFTGKLTAMGPSLTLGSGENSLSYFRWSKGSGWTDSVMGLMNLSGSVMTVSIGAVSDSFTVSGSTYTPTEGNGATLTLSGTTFTYTSADGTVAHFDKTKANTYVTYGNNGMITDIVSPSGERRGFGYEAITFCTRISVTGLCQQTGKAYRPIAVTSSYGYALSLGYGCDYEYDPTDPYLQPDFSCWGEMNNVGALNRAVSETAIVASQSFGAVFSGGVTNYIVTDVEGRQTKFRVSGNTVAGITYPGHTSEDVTFGYSGSAVTSVTRAGVGTTTYSRSDSGNTRTVTVTPPAVTPALSATVYTFDIAQQRMKSVTVTEGGISRTTSFDYDSSGRLTQTTKPEGNYVHLARDARGNVTETRAVGKAGSGVADIVTTADYDVTCSNPVKCNQPNWTIDAKGNKTDYSYDPTHGGVLTVTLPPDPSGVRPQTRYGYASLRAYFYSSGSIVASSQSVYRLTSISACRTLSSCLGSTDERRTVVDYGPQTAGVGNNLNFRGTTTSLGDGTLAATTTSTYDSMGNIETVDGPLPGAADRMMMAYNLDRQLLWQIGADPDGTGAALFPAVKYTYRSDGEIDLIQSGTVTAQSASGMSSFAPLQRQEVTYDGFSRPIRQTLTDGAGTAYQVTDVIYDAVGRVQCSMLRMDPGNWGSLPSSCIPTQTAGPNGPDRVSYNSYDELSRVWAITSGYATTAAADEFIATFTGNGQLNTIQDGQHNRTTYEYDGHDRRVKTRFPVTTISADLSSTTDYEQVGYDPNGNATSFRTRRGETLTLNYDNLNRLTSKIVPERSGLAATHTRDVYFGYDLLGDMSYARFDSASGEGITSAFNALGQLTSTTNNMDGTSRTLAYLYDVAGNLTQLTHPDGNFFAYTRNAAGGLEQLKLSPARGLLRPILDSAGRLSSIYRWRTVPGDWLARSNFGYDNNSRLLTLGTDVTNASYDSTTTFSYNPANQIANTTRTNDIYAWTGQVNADKTYTPDGLSRYTGPFGYDANGNLTSDSTNTFVYDVENRLVTRSGGASATLRYDPLGRLYEVVSGSTTRRFLYDGSDLVAEYNASGTMQRRYAHGTGAGDDPLVMFEGSGISDSARRFLYADERGSIIAVGDTTGSVLNVNTYDEYGVPGSTNVGTFQYTGQMWMPELGMYYYKARMYSPILGRFLQTDPIGYGDGMNMYSYVHSDPLNFMDMSGLDTLCGPNMVARDDGGRPNPQSEQDRIKGRQNGATTAAGAQYNCSPAPVADGGEVSAPNPSHSAPHHDYTFAVPGIPFMILPAASDLYGAMADAVNNSIPSPCSKSGKATIRGAMGGAAYGVVTGKTMGSALVGAVTGAASGYYQAQDYSNQTGQLIVLLAAIGAMNNAGGGATGYRVALGSVAGTRRREIGWIRNSRRTSDRKHNTRRNHGVAGRRQRCERWLGRI